MSQVVNVKEVYKIQACLNGLHLEEFDENIVRFMNQHLSYFLDSSRVNNTVAQALGQDSGILLSNGERLYRIYLKPNYRNPNCIVLEVASLDNQISQTYNIEFMGDDKTRILLHRRIGKKDGYNDNVSDLVIDNLYEHKDIRQSKRKEQFIGANMAAQNSYLKEVHIFYLGKPDNYVEMVKIEAEPNSRYKTGTEYTKHKEGHSYPITEEEFKNNMLKLYENKTFN